jgi:membrane protease YdiL (CAAX protease family)
VTSPENPFAGSKIPGVPREPETPADDAKQELKNAEIAQVFPSWGMTEVLIVLGITVGAIFFSTFLMTLIATGLPAFRNATTKQMLSDARVLVPAQSFAYCIVLFFIYRIVAGYKHVSFAEAIQWRWPRLQWPVFVVGGVVMAFSLLALERVLPMPKQLPIQEMFNSRTAAWMMLVLGVAIAPLLEELFFRGLLFPVLARHLNIAWAVLVTGFLFALIHASQLGHAWAPLLVLVIVGVVLTTVRWLAKSVAAAVLVHVGYNGTLFLLLLSATGGFRHLEKVAR